MKKVILITLAVAIVVVISGVGVFLMSGGASEAESEIAKASAEFKANPGFRQHVANKLIPHLTIDMTTNEVEALLGNLTRNGNTVTACFIPMACSIPSL